MRFPLALLVALLLPALGCGGGGGDAPPPTDAFNGTYHWAQYIVRRGPPLVGTAGWGTLTANGRGTMTGGAASSISNGALDAGPLGSSPYEIFPGNRIHWLAEGRPVVEGGISADGGLSIFTSRFAGGTPLISALVRQESGLGLASLTGPYHIAQFATSATGLSDMAIWGSVNFNGSGGAAFTLWSNVDGVLNGPIGGGGSYTVAPDGALTLNIGSIPYRGGIARGGRFGIFGGSTAGGNAAGIGVLLAYSTTASLATFNGTYHAVMMHADALPTPVINWTSYGGTIDVDGLGGWVWTSLTRMRDDGSVTMIPGPHPVGPYTVAPNGGMTFAASTLGAISADGDVAALVGSTAPGIGPSLWFLIR